VGTRSRLSIGVLSEQHTGVNLERKRGATRISALPALARPLEMDGRGVPPPVAIFARNARPL